MALLIGLRALSNTAGQSNDVFLLNSKQVFLLKLTLTFFAEVDSSLCISFIALLPGVLHCFSWYNCGALQIKLVKTTC